MTDNHQYKNAKVLADADAAVLIEEKDLTDERMLSEVSRLANDEAVRAEMSKNVAAFGNSEAGKKIYEQICELLRRKRVIVERID